MEPNQPTSEAMEFGRFRILPHRRELLEGPAVGTRRAGSALRPHDKCCRDLPMGCGQSGLAPLFNPGFVLVTVATALGLDLAGSPASPERVANALGSKQLMLVLDN